MNSLVILLGPTGVGKTELSSKWRNVSALRLSLPTPVSSIKTFRSHGCPYTGTNGTCQALYVGTLSLTDYYSASNFEEDVVSLLSELHKTIPTVVMTGGSMMYIDAVCKGIDDIPTVTPEIRDALYMQF